MVDTIYGSKERTKVLLFHEKAFSNRTIRLSNRTNLLLGIKKLHPRRSAAVKRMRQTITYQYSKPNIQRGILLPKLISVLSVTT